MRRIVSGRLRIRGGGFTLIEVLVVVAIIALLLAILMPSLGRARSQARSAVCLSNLRQFALAAHAYGYGHKGRYPIDYYSPPYDPAQPDAPCISYAWDFTVIVDWNAGTRTVKPGLLWQGSKTIAEIHQCPVYEGGDNWADIPYSGYNYNTSYIGTYLSRRDPARPEDVVVVVAPANAGDVRRPDACALFGDGEYVGGTNKFMRAPWKDPADGGYTGPPARDAEEFSDGKARYTGTQGYRHLGRTNVAFCDGHAQSWLARCTDTYEAGQAHIAAGTGFLSCDNGLYDLK